MPAVTAIADTDAGMRETAAALAGPEVRAFEDPRDLLAADVADALVIATPNHTHVDHLLPALETGLPIMVEKPLCTTAGGLPHGDRGGRTDGPRRSGSPWSTATCRRSPG